MNTVVAGDAIVATDAVTVDISTTASHDRSGRWLMADDEARTDESDTTTCPHCGDRVGSLLMIGPTEAIGGCGCRIPPNLVVDFDRESADENG